MERKGQRKRKFDVGAMKEEVLCGVALLVLVMT